MICRDAMRGSGSYGMITVLRNSYSHIAYLNPLGYYHRSADDSSDFTASLCFSVYLFHHCPYGRSTCIRRMALAVS